MVRRDDTKTQALEASRTLNPRPERVADPAFGPGGFFDPADLVQVKYEMVRKAEAADVPASRAAAPGLRPADLAAAVRQHFGVSVHPRSVERALQRRRTTRREDEQGAEQPPGAASKSP